MNHLETFLLWTTLSFEFVVCGLVFARKAYRVLPLFATYVCVVFTSSIVVWNVYKYAGFDSPAGYYCYWGSILVNATARSFAIAELCSFGLRTYRGIWALVWRVLAALSTLLLIDLALDAWGQPNGIAIYGATLDRDLALATIAILAALLLMRRYYGISLGLLERQIAIGICFICSVDVIGNTIFRSRLTGYFLPWFLASQQALWPTLKPQLRQIGDVWDTVHLFSFMFTMGIWCHALRKPLPQASPTPELLPAHVYQELSPAINLRLNAFNDRLVELLKS